MKKIAAIFTLTALLALPSLAQAKPITLTTELNGYNGDGAYLAIYLTDADGKYQDTLWVAGGKAKYYKHLRDWARGSALKAAAYDGAGQATLGTGYVKSFTYQLP